VARFRSVGFSNPHRKLTEPEPHPLVTTVRIPVQDDPRVIFPEILYNRNPGAYPARPVPHLALYEEHRLRWVCGATLYNGAKLTELGALE